MRGLDDGSDDMARHSTFDIDRLLEGALDPEDAPVELATVAALVRAARGPAQAQELVAAGHLVPVIVATVREAPITAASPADTPTTRRHRTKVLALGSVVASTLLLASGAAAAAAGALPPSVQLAVSRSLAHVGIVVPRPAPAPATHEDTSGATSMESRAPRAAQHQGVRHQGVQHQAGLRERRLPSPARACTPAVEPAGSRSAARSSAAGGSPTSYDARHRPSERCAGSTTVPSAKARRVQAAAASRAVRPGHHPATLPGTPAVPTTNRVRTVGRPATPGRDQLGRAHQSGMGPAGRDPRRQAHPRIPVAHRPQPTVTPEPTVARGHRPTPAGSQAPPTSKRPVPAGGKPSRGSTTDATASTGQHQHPSATTPGNAGAPKGHRPVMATATSATATSSATPIEHQGHGGPSATASPSGPGKHEGQPGTLAPPRAAGASHPSTTTTATPAAQPTAASGARGAGKGGHRH